VSDTFRTRERLGHDCLRVRGVSSGKILLFYLDTVATRSRHGRETAPSKVKVEKKKKQRKFAKLVASEPSITGVPTETLRSPFLSLMCFWLLSSYFIFSHLLFTLSDLHCCFSISPVFFFFFSPYACSVGWAIHKWCGLIVSGVAVWVLCFLYIGCRVGSGISPASPGVWATPLPRATKKKKNFNSIYRKKI
jgi:hypothetical protein